jgi:hypothetical protein
MGSYRNADVRTFGKAFTYLKGWKCLGYVHRFGQKAPWYIREGQRDTRRFIPAPSEDDYGDLI